MRLIRELNQDNHSQNKKQGTFVKQIIGITVALEAIGGTLVEMWGLLHTKLKTKDSSPYLLAPKNLSNHIPNTSSAKIYPKWAAYSY